nr:hypothetical protein [Tanacetum cinerariifolium]
MSFYFVQSIVNRVIDDVMRRLSFDEIELDGEVDFGNVAGSSIDNTRLSYDESFGVDDLDLHLNLTLDLNVSQIETQEEDPVSEVPNEHVDNESHTC